MVLCKIFVTEERNARDRMQPQGMEEAGELGKTPDGNVLPLGRQWVLERYVNQAVQVLYVEDDGIAAGFPPTPNQLQTMLTASHVAGKVNTAHLEILGDGNRLLDQRRDENAGDGQSGRRAEGTFLSCRGSPVWMAASNSAVVM